MLSEKNCDSSIENFFLFYCKGNFDNVCIQNSLTKSQGYVFLKIGAGSGPVSGLFSKTNSGSGSDANFKEKISPGDSVILQKAQIMVIFLVISLVKFYQDFLPLIAGDTKMLPMSAVEKSTKLSRVLL